MEYTEFRHTLKTKNPKLSFRVSFAEKEGLQPASVCLDLTDVAIILF
jgi:hypothetical protein